MIFNFDENYPETVIRVRIMAWRNIVKQCKAFKNVQQRMNFTSTEFIKMVGLMRSRR